MTRIRIAYYVVKKGHGYWQPTAEMRQQGAQAVACGPDGPVAWARAKAAYDAWQRREKPRLPASKAPLAGTIAAAFEEYARTPEWAAKAPATREEWRRAWGYIGPAFGPCKPAVITMAVISAFRANIEKRVSRREAQRVIKIWRALWKVMQALRYTTLSDPSAKIHNPAPQPRNASWTHLEAIRLCKTAWRGGFRGLAALIAVTWDSGFSPVDARTLNLASYAGGVFSLKRAKTGKSAIGTLSRPTRKVLDAYLAMLPALTPNAPIFRNRSGQPYRTRQALGEDFRVVRALAFGSDEKRTLADFRRSGVIEAVRGGAESGQIGAKLGNQFEKSSFIRKTYSPIDLAAVRAADEARKRGRK